MSSRRSIRLRMMTPTYAAIIRLKRKVSSIRQDAGHGAPAALPKVRPDWSQHNASENMR
jgi:hypothetical protein